MEVGPAHRSYFTISLQDWPIRFRPPTPPLAPAMP